VVQLRDPNLIKSRGANKIKFTLVAKNNMTISVETKENVPKYNFRTIRGALNKSYY
jgi:hypothetical protein